MRKCPYCGHELTVGMRCPICRKEFEFKLEDPFIEGMYTPIFKEES